MRTSITLKSALSVCAALLLSLTLGAQTIADNVKLRVERQDGIYAKGETVKVWADVAEVPAGNVILRTYKNAVRKPVKIQALNLSSGENLLLEASYDEAQAIMLQVGYKEKELAKDKVLAGFLVAPEEFTPGFDEPKDLMSWWGKEIKKMRKMKMKADVKSVELTVKNANASRFEAFHVELNCVGDAPVRGYMVKPKEAAKGSLPIIIFAHGAGVNKPHCKSTIQQAFNQANCVPGGAIGFDINAHGMLNDQPQSYYDELFNGQLKNYSIREPETRDNYYFKFMFLRLQRLVDYLVTDPAWDGKHIIMVGSSQGGAQSAFIASVDPRITTAVITVPAMIDQGSKLKGRRGTWPGVFEKAGEDSAAGSVCPYFDPALMLKYSKADFWVEIGLFDETCPPADVFAGINQIKTSKEVHTFQRGHGMPPGQAAKAAHRPIDKSRSDFIKAQAVK